jgi:uncharacterized membrane protein YkoI
MLGRAAAIGILSLFAVLAGCSDNTTGPTANDNTPPGSSGTVQVSDPVSANEAEAVRVNILRNTRDTIIISIDQVIQAALQNGGGELMGVNLDYDNDSLNYECVVRSGGKVYLVVVDPKSGQVKKKQEIQNYYYTTVIVIRQLAIKVNDAKDRAKKVTDGDVVECNLENIDDEPTYVVILLTRDNRYVTCYIDAKTGKEKKLKDDGKCDDKPGDDHKNDRGRGHYRHGYGHGYGHSYHCHCHCGDGDSTGVHDSTGVDTTKIPAGAIKADSARIIAGHVIDSATVSDLKLRVTNDSTAFYDAKLQRDSNRYEVTLDAFTGSVISIKQTAGDFKNTDYSPQVKGDTLVKLSVARTAALAQLAGDVTAWKLEYDTTETKWVYTFDIKTAMNGTKQVMVDAKTGLFIRIK